MEYLECFKKMLNKQDEFNQKIHTEWREQQYDWCQALFLETAEQGDSLAWKWWKAGEDDLANFKVEVIDNWHFLMSLGMQYWSKSYLSEKFTEVWDMSYHHIDIYGIDLKQATKEFAYNILSIDVECNKEPSLIQDKYFDACWTLFSLMIRLGIESPLELNAEYLVKNVLNSFRQDNGYKEGTYQKMWIGSDGKEYEDNVIAFEMLKENPEMASEKLYEALTFWYKTMNEKDSNGK